MKLLSLSLLINKLPKHNKIKEYIQFLVIDSNNNIEGLYEKDLPDLIKDFQEFIKN